ncbi:MAG TPA: hypothetical protein VJS64_00770, partial [Pyrinomonadaceae bacterium]|nr:hypothetical protein [Pyrinomonadaceae bacterium]
MNQNHAEPAAKVCFILLIAFGFSLFVSSSSISLGEQGSNKAKITGYGPATQLTILKDKSIKESSGIAASRNHPGIYWTHNDSGDGPFIYAFDIRGDSRGVWRVTGASAEDWEDMAAGPGPRAGTNYLYLGDIGDNK